MHQFPLSSLMINVLICILICCTNAQAGVVVGGTRFVYPEKQSSISVELKNTASKDMLVKISVTPDDGRQLKGHWNPSLYFQIRRLLPHHHYWYLNKIKMPK